tara:strand:+ start:305 stop:907 length:603 start_codon:yes stop_codon:yes gene_type:complete
MNNIYTYNIVYQITNKVNNKIYIGVHSTNNLNDGYMGSGHLIKRAIKKYGIENFTREILYYFDSPEQAFSKEKEIVNESFVNQTKNYNICPGGRGGNLGNHRGCQGEKNPMFGRKHTKESLDKMRKPKSKTDKMGRYKRTPSTIEKQRKVKIKNIYVIEGVEYYDGETKTAELLGLNLNTFKDRIRTRSKTFKDWYKKPM